MDNDSPQFVDAEDFVSKKDQFNFKMLCLQHLQRITVISCSEFRGGYWQTKYDKNRSWDEYIPDARQQYMNGIDCFYDLLYSRFDSDMKKADKDLTKELEDCHKDYKKDYKKAEEDNDKTIPQLQQKFLNNKIRIKRKLFREICNLLFRLNYLEISQQRGR